MLASDFLGKNSPLVTSYKALMTLHDYLRDMHDLTKVRDKLDKKLFAGAERVYSNMDDIHKAF
jgi:two-component SAPR family response regulator